MTFRKTVLVLAFCLATAAAYPVRRWTYAEEEGDTNYDFGKAFGKEFERELKVRLSSDTSLKKLVEEFGTENNYVYEQFMASHKTAFPEYMDELQGVADGSGVPFKELFIDQLKEEFTYFKANQTDSREELRRVHHCSDVVLYQSSGNIYMAHNEDSASFDVNGTVLVEAVNGVNGKPGFTSLTYGKHSNGSVWIQYRGCCIYLKLLGSIKSRPKRFRPRFYCKKDVGQLWFR